jgi:hypothetical protein
VATNRINEIESSEKQWRNVYLLGGVTAIIALTGILLDVIIGNITGGNLSALPQRATDIYAQFRDNHLLGLYNLDLLNIVNQISLIPTYFSLYAAHRNVSNAYAALALIIFLVGTVIFVATNIALPILELSNKYFAATSELQKMLFAAAGEAMLARGSHGSPGVFIGFILPNVAGILMSYVMLTGEVFSKIASYLGIAGSTLLVVYVMLVTFVPQAKNIATILAMPGGLMAMAWMILFTIRLFQLGRHTRR